MDLGNHPASRKSLLKLLLGPINGATVPALAGGATICRPDADQSFIASAQTLLEARAVNYYSASRNSEAEPFIIFFCHLFRLFLLEITLLYSCFQAQDVFHVYSRKRLFISAPITDSKGWFRSQS